VPAQAIFNRRSVVSKTTQWQVGEENHKDVFLQSAVGGADLLPVPPRLFRFVVFQKGSTTDYEYFADNFVIGSPTQTVDVIKQAARNRIKEPTYLGMDDEIKVYEVCGVLRRMTDL